MGMTRGTALVATVARVVQLTGVQDLADLEGGSELTLTDLLTTASDAIYDQLNRDGEDPTAITNEEVYESAVAWHFLARLVIGGYVPLPTGLNPPTNEKGQADPYAWSDPYYARVRPTYAAGTDSPATAGESIPVIRNVSKRPLFGGQLS